MAWVKLDDQAPRHQKVLEAGPAAAWFWVCGIAHCQSQLTDGHISDAALPMIGVPKGFRKLAEHLVHVGLFEHAQGGGYLVHDYLKHNDSRGIVMRKRADDLARKRRGSDAESTQIPSGIQSDSIAPRARVPSHPIPSGEERKAAPPARTALATAPNANGNYRVIERLAFQMVAQGSYQPQDVRIPIQSEADLVDAVKHACAQNWIDYGLHPDVDANVVHRACASEWAKHIQGTPRKKKHA